MDIVLHLPRIHVFSPSNCWPKASEAWTSHFCPSTASTIQRDHDRIRFQIRNFRPSQPFLSKGNSGPTPTHGVGGIQFSLVFIAMSRQFLGMLNLPCVIRSTYDNHSQKSTAKQGKKSFPSLGVCPIQTAPIRIVNPPLRHELSPPIKTPPQRPICLQDRRMRIKEYGCGMTSCKNSANDNGLPSGSYACGRRKRSPDLSLTSAP